MNEFNPLQLKCSSCGAAVEYFDIVKQEYRCSACGSGISAHSVKENYDNWMHEHAQETAKTVGQHTKDGLLCPSCGAEVSFKTDTKGELIQTTCEYCGTHFVASPPGEKFVSPDMLIPFFITLKEAKERLREWCEKNKFTDEAKLILQHIDELKGYYLPYEVVKGPMRFKVTRDKTKGDGGKTAEYFTCGGYLNGTAVSTNSDQHNLTLDGMEPFDWSGARAYDIGYIAGQSVKLQDIYDKEELNARVFDEVEHAYLPVLEKELHTKGITAKVTDENPEWIRGTALLPAYVLNIENRPAEIDKCIAAWRQISFKKVFEELKQLPTPQEIISSFPKPEDLYESDDLYKIDTKKLYRELQKLTDLVQHYFGSKETIDLEQLFKELNALPNAKNLFKNWKELDKFHEQRLHPNEIYYNLYERLSVLEETTKMFSTLPDEDTKTTIHIAVNGQTGRVAVEEIRNRNVGGCWWVLPLLILLIGSGILFWTLPSPTNRMAIYMFIFLVGISLLFFRQGRTRSRSIVSILQGEEVKASRNGSLLQIVKEKLPSQTATPVFFEQIGDKETPIKKFTTFNRRQFMKFILGGLLVAFLSWIVTYILNIAFGYPLAELSFLASYSIFIVLFVFLPSIGLFYNSFFNNPILYYEDVNGRIVSIEYNKLRGISDRKKKRRIGLIVFIVVLIGLLVAWSIDYFVINPWYERITY